MHEAMTALAGRGLSLTPPTPLLFMVPLQTAALQPIQQTHIDEGTIRSENTTSAGEHTRNLGLFNTQGETGTNSAQCRPILTVA